MSFTKNNQAHSESSSASPFQIDSALIGLGLKENDHQLLRYLNFFAAQIPIKSIDFVHVVPIFDLLTALFRKDHANLAGQYELNEHIVKHFEDQVKLDFKRSKASSIQYQIFEGDPLEEILSYADKAAADLMVIGQDATRRSHDILAKNMARNVKRNALIVPAKAKEGLSNILVAIDFSPYSIEALQTALSIRERLGSQVQITCIHIYELPGLSPHNFRKTEAQFREIMQEDRQAAMNLFLDNYAPSHKDQIQTALLTATIKGVAEDVYKYAQESDIDFIVIGSKGHSAVASLLMGSVTEGLMGINKSIATLIVRC